MQPAFRETPWPVLRNGLTAFLDHKRSNVINATLEVDVTEALAAIRRANKALGVAVSFHAWIVWCIAQGAMAHPIVHTYRRGNKLITFEDIDILSPIDKHLPGGVRIPVGHIIRAVQTKSLAQINDEIRKAVRADDLADDKAVAMRRRFATWPAPVRGLFAWYTARNPLWFKRTHGTLLITNIRSQGFPNAFFAITPTVHTLSVAVGNTVQRLRLDAREQLVQRTMLCMGAALDHNIIDGMNGARFAYHVCRLLESAAGLDENFIREARSINESNSEALPKSPADKVGTQSAPGL